MAGDDGVRCPHDDVAPPHRQEVRAGRTLARLAQCVWGSGGGGVALYTSMVAGLYGRWQSESVLNHNGDVSQSSFCAAAACPRVPKYIFAHLLTLRTVETSPHCPQAGEFFSVQHCKPLIVIDPHETARSQNC